MNCLIISQQEKGNSRDDTTIVIDVMDIGFKKGLYTIMPSKTYIFIHTHKQINCGYYTRKAY